MFSRGHSVLLLQVTAIIVGQGGVPTFALSCSSARAGVSGLWFTWDRLRWDGHSVNVTDPSLRLAFPWRQPETHHGSDFSVYLSLLRCRATFPPGDFALGLGVHSQRAAGNMARVTAAPNAAAGLRGIPCSLGKERLQRSRRWHKFVSIHRTWSLGHLLCWPGFVFTCPSNLPAFLGVSSQH